MNIIKNWRFDSYTNSEKGVIFRLTVQNRYFVLVQSIFHVTFALSPSLLQVVINFFILTISIFLNISMMLNKKLIRCYWVSVTKSSVNRAYYFPPFFSAAVVSKSWLPKIQCIVVKQIWWGKGKFKSVY